MRSLKKNQRELYYASYIGTIEIYEHDEDGDIVFVEVDGEEVPIVKSEEAGYDKPVLFYASVSPGKGTAQEELFGKEIDFTRAISSADISLSINELSLIWVESKPTYFEDGRVNPKSADYKVVAPIAKGLNSLMIAIKELPKGAD